MDRDGLSDSTGSSSTPGRRGARAGLAPRVVLFFVVSLGIIEGCKRTEQALPRAKAAKQTIAHRLLEQERHFVHECSNGDGRAWYDRHAKVLDALLSRIDERLDAESQQIPLATPEDAVNLLRRIDVILHEEGYVACLGTEWLSQTLGSPVPNRTTIQLSDRRCNLVEYPAHRSLAKAHERVRPFDCDVGTFLYLSIAQRRGWPLVAAEVPNHFFVRWRFPDGTYTNWDINNAASFTDDQYRHQPLRNAGAPFDRAIEERHRYLIDRTDAELIGYYVSILPLQHATENCLNEAMHRVGASPWRSTLLNNLAWSYSTDPKFRGLVRAARAVALSRQAIQLEPKCGYWDTLSCALAASGDFQEAERVEVEHVSARSARVQWFRNGMDCYDSRVADVGACHSGDRD